MPPFFHIIPSSAILKYPSGSRIRWSTSLISMISPASIIFFVISLSASVGKDFQRDGYEPAGFLLLKLSMQLEICIWCQPQFLWCLPQKPESSQGLYLPYSEKEYKMTPDGQLEVPNYSGILVQLQQKSWFLSSQKASQLGGIIFLSQLPWGLDSHS